MHASEEMESNEDLKLYEQPLPSAGEEVKMNILIRVLFDLDIIIGEYQYILIFLF